jgi:hypothetical protein
MRIKNIAMVNNLMVSPTPDVGKMIGINILIAARSILISKISCPAGFAKIVTLQNH